jgi:hypothetical protein
MAPNITQIQKWYKFKNFCVYLLKFSELDILIFLFIVFNIQMHLLIANNF